VIRRFVTRHRPALLTISAAAVLDILLGVAFGFADHVSTWDGLYFATTTGTTVGYGDITPKGWLPHLLAIALMVIAIPLFGASFSLFTAGLSAIHIRDSEDRIKAHVEVRLASHQEAMKAHVAHLVRPRPGRWRRNPYKRA
jgi:Ion channel